jgi:hypothetical protein
MPHVYDPAVRSKKIFELIDRALFCCDAISPELAQRGLADRSKRRLLLGVKRTSL